MTRGTALHRRLLLGLATFLVMSSVAMWCQWLVWVPAKVRLVTSKEFAEQAYRLDEDANWVYGFELLHHGAVLVRVERSQGLDEGRLWGEDPRSQRIRELPDPMLGELRGIPHKAAAESVFYLLLCLAAAVGATLAGPILISSAQTSR